MGNFYKEGVAFLLALPLSSLKGYLDGGREVAAFNLCKWMLGYLETPEVRRLEESGIPETLWRSSLVEGGWGWGQGGQGVGGEK